jgi:hypothetical protein
MTEHSTSNEGIKRQYFAYLKEAKRHSEATVDAAQSRFETTPTFAISKHSIRTG